jgi:hypothetical protein
VCEVAGGCGFFQDSTLIFHPQSGCAWIKNSKFANYPITRTVLRIATQFQSAQPHDIGLCGIFRVQINTDMCRRVN